MRRIIFTITPEAEKDLDFISKEQGISRSLAIREALRHFAGMIRKELATKETPTPRKDEKP